MSKPTVALSVHPTSRGYGSIYARHFEEAGAYVRPTVDFDDIQPDQGRYWGRFGAHGPESIRERLHLIRAAGILAVVTVGDRPSPGEGIAPHTLAPDPDQQIDIAVAAGAQVPICMLDGLPGLSTQRLEPLGTVSALENFEVKPFPGDPYAQFSERIQWALSHIQHQEGS